MAEEYVQFTGSGILVRAELNSYSKSRPVVALGMTAYYPSKRQARQMARIVFRREWDKNGKVVA